MRDSSDAKYVLGRQKDEDVAEKLWSCEDSFASLPGRISEDLLDVLTLSLWSCQLLLLSCLRMLRPTSCAGGTVSWTAMMGTIRFMRFFEMVTSKNVSWRMRYEDTPLVGPATAVLISAMLSRNREDKMSKSGKVALLFGQEQVVKGLAEVSNERSLQ